MLDGTVTDSVEAHAIGLNHKYIQIYRCAWVCLLLRISVDA